MYRINQTFLPFAAIAALSLTGCGSVEGEFPSLAKRPYEKANPIEEPAAVAETLTMTLSADLQREVDALVSRSSVAHSAFENALGSTRSALQSAGNSATGSEPWANAHTLLSRTDSLRADGVAALGEMDRLVSLEREKGSDSGLVALLSAPQTIIAERVASQNAEIEQLTKLIGL